MHHGSERLEGKEFQREVKGVNLVITTYALALRDREQLGEVAGADLIDEAQAIKNAATKQAPRSARSAPRAGSRCRTPVENRLADLWSIMEFANPGLLGSAEQFKDRFARPIERGNEGADAAAERLRQATSAFVLRRVKTDPSIISDLPDKVEMPVVCNLTSEQASLYQAEVDRMLAAVQSAKDSIGKKGIVLAGLTRLKQICDHPALFLKDGSRLRPQRQAGARGRPLRRGAERGRAGAAVHPVRRVRRHAAAPPRRALRRPVAFLHGGTEGRAGRAGAPLRAAGRPAAVRALAEGGRRRAEPDRGEPRAARGPLVEPGGGEPGHRPRFRIGQRKNVQVRKLMCAGTLEERIDRVIEDKKGLAERIVGSGESWLTELSVTQLRDLVLLSGDPVAE